MFIKSLSLHNIRTYEKETIEFQEGTTLLTGDIGSGKTTILLAIEFALFGLLRGKTQPSELLRHSASEGSITLHVEIAGKEVIVTRGLKRGKSAIAQTPGVLVIDGVEETYVATELKAKILTLLGYPESLLSKSTNLFRYTVYTPQEQVKHILHETVEERKDIVRKIFGVDKYKQVVENITPYVSDVRERISHGKGQLSDVKTLQEQLEISTKELKELQVQQKPIQQSYETAQAQTKQAKAALELKQKEKEEQQKELAKQQVAIQQLQGEQRMLEMITRQVQELSQQLEKTQVKKVEYDTLMKKKIQEALEKISTNKSLLSKKYGALEAKQQQSKELQEQISKLTTCPTCQQEVGDNHKQHISHIQEQVLKEVAKKRTEYDALFDDLQEKEKKLRERLLEEQEKEKQFLLFKQQEQRLLADTKRIEQLQLQHTQKQKTLAELQEQISKHKEIKPIDSSVQDKAYEIARTQEQQLALTLRELQTKEKAVQTTISQIEKALEVKKNIQEQVNKLTMTRTWVQDLFVPLVKTIEKRVLLRIYQEFNTYFTQWFSMLIDDESLTVRLDEDFTPLIEQHGYDTDVGNLSGGEKTSVALAYRLALNKVLNDYFSSLHTKGLLILDEPTDGFSTQQLDKLRDVLDQIGVKQVIIVSHEPKLESVAQHLIAVHKDTSVSRVRYA